MAAKLTDTVLKEIDLLAETSEKLSRDASVAGSCLGADRIEELRGVTTRLAHLMLALCGDGSPQVADLERIQSQKRFAVMHSKHFSHVSELAGLAKAFRHQAREGLLVDLRSVVRAEVFSDFLEMAEHLLDEGYKDPAAVLTGAVLEDTLRKLADAAGIPISNNGKSLTIDPLNVALCKASLYNALVQKQITAWADLRNKAAHGRFAEYNADDVRRMLVFVQGFCADRLK